MINAKLTELLLKNISSRLSGREDCKKISYKVMISSDNISMEPVIQVYRDKHHRKDADKMDILAYVHQYKMPNLHLDELVPGNYEYQLSVDGRNRRWRKLI